MRRLPQLSGPFPALPAALDRWSERWWALSPRVRLSSAVAAALLVVIGFAIADGSEPSTAVLVTTRDLAAGDPVDPASVTVVERPAGTVPEGALRGLPQGAESLGPIPRGAVLTRVHLTEAGLAATVAAGRVATAVPAEALPPGIAPGQHVDLLAGTPDGQTRVLASGARVLTVGQSHVWLEVSRDEAAHVASAAAWGRIGVALLPQSPASTGATTDGGAEGDQ